MVCDSFSVTFAQTLDRHKVGTVKKASFDSLPLSSEIAVLTMGNIALYILFFSSTTQKSCQILMALIFNIPTISFAKRFC